MEEKNCEVLFEYLRSILYDSEIKQLDIETLDPAFRKLGMGLQFLSHAVEEMQQCSAALANGNLSAFSPSRDNFLCENLKSIHANLNHLTWQAKQVAKGDYSQTVSYMGEFSEAFNAMVTQLRERESKLKEEARLVRQHYDAVEGYNKLLLELISRSEEDVLVTSARMEWQGEHAYAHIILEITRERAEQDRWQLKAYSDTLTGIGNRSFFMSRITELIKTEEAMVICYCDLDHLKYVNDNHGHTEGDTYIISFVEATKHHIRDNDVFARLGGDEFCIIFRDCQRATVEERMAQIQQDFAKAINRMRRVSATAWCSFRQGTARSILMR